MGRPKRTAPGGWVYHVLNRANARMPILKASLPSAGASIEARRLEMKHGRPQQPKTSALTSPLAHKDDQNPNKRLSRDGHC
ncbi:MAG TPA: hypothetical protein PLR25_03380, partial [Planctomycetaceae bacterium]|nr:hypothetical protein [Planctomycetaceae bacterium]